jgi:iron-sulfur cluster assembly accessory protein
MNNPNNSGDSHVELLSPSVLGDRVELTQRAATKALELQETNPDLRGGGLRLYLDGKGCDGFYYGVAFDPISEEDQVFNSLGVQIVVDPQTLPFVVGSSIDWVDDERGKGFLVENPNHRKFRGKFFKRENWQDRLNLT